MIRYAIGIGSGINYSELRLILGDNATDSQRVYTVENFDAVKNILYSVKTTQCTQPLDYEIFDSEVDVTLGSGTTYAKVEKTNAESEAVFITLDLPT